MRLSGGQPTPVLHGLQFGVGHGQSSVLTTLMISRALLGSKTPILARNIENTSDG